MGRRKEVEGRTEEEGEESEEGVRRFTENSREKRGGKDRER